MKPPFLKAYPLLEQIEDAGFEAYFVGGSVRDFLLNREISDVDIATSATPSEIKGIFPKTVDVGIAHGTVMVLYQGETYEVTTFRSESEYQDFRRPNEVTFIRSLEEDLRRRDFTMNAIAMNKKGEIIDPFDGQAAIKNKVIQTVGLADERFHEDALRMMRALRFASQLAFTIEPKTLLALKENGKLLEKISVERITIEFEKLLLGVDSRRAMKLLLETGLFQYLPGFKKKEEGLTTFLSYKIGPAFSIEEHWVLLLHLLGVLPQETEAFLRKWKLPLQKIRRVKNGVYWLHQRLARDLSIYDLYTAQRERAMSTEKLYHVLMKQDDNRSIESLEVKFRSMPVKNRSELAVTGRDLMDWYEKNGGPWIEERLLSIEKAVLKGEVFNRKDEIKEWLFTCNRP